MKTYEEFLEFLETHLNHMSDFVPVDSKDFHAVCYATASFLLAEPYRWEKLLPEWPKLPQVEKPEESELLEFFEKKGMSVSFGKELKANDLDTLYNAYDLLFPCLVLKDDFLTAVFREDLPRRRYKKIFKQSNRKIERVVNTINSLKIRDEFIALMKQFTADLEGFSLTLINNKRLLDQVVQKFIAGGK